MSKLVLYIYLIFIKCIVRTDESLEQKNNIHISTNK